MTDPTATTWASFRDAMSVQGVYLDHAACGPITTAAADAMRAYVDDFALHGSTNWPRFRGEVEVARQHFADLLGARAAEIALVRNTTEGITLVAEGIDWQPGDNIVMAADEFPSNLFPWQNLKRLGVECRVVDVPKGSPTVRIDPAPLAAACDARTRLLTCSWVGYKLGDRVDLAALRQIADDYGALLFVDAIQGLGMHPLDVHAAGIDFLAADGHKWLLGPEGAGVLFVRESRLPELQPLGVGWNSVAEAASFDGSRMNLRSDAARYEGGTYPAVTMAGLAASLTTLAAQSPAARESRLVELVDHLRDRCRSRGGRIVSPDDAAHRSAITAVAFNDPDAMRARGMKAGVPCSVRGGYLRLAPHAYQTETDLDHAIDVLCG